MEGISKARLLEIARQTHDSDDTNHIVLSLFDYLIAECKELNPWLPIADAPKGKEGFLAINQDRDCIEWLSDIGEDKFYNNNSNNFTDKAHFTHYKLLPDDPK